MSADGEGENIEGSPEYSGTPPGSPPPQRGNLGALVLAQVVAFGTGLVVQVFLARVLGKELFGAYSFLVGVTILFTFVAQMNLRLLLARDVARAPDTAPSVLGLGLVTTAVLSLFATGGVVAYTAGADGRAALVVAALVAGIALGFRSLGLVAEAVFQGLRRMRVLADATVVGRVVLLLATVALVLGGAGLPGVFGAQALSEVCFLAVMLVVFGRAVGRPRWAVRPREVTGLVWDARHYGLNQLFGAVYLSSDLLVLQAFHGDEELGVYRAATILLVNLPVVATVLNKAVYPRMVSHVGDPPAAGAELGFELRLLLAASLPMFVGGLCVAQPLIVFLVGDEYRAATTAFLWLLPMLPLRFVNNTLANTLSALGHQPARTRGVAIAAFVNLGLNLVIVPIYGAAGAAATTLFTEMVLTAWLGWRVAPWVSGVGLWGPVWRACLPTLPMAAVVLAVPGWHVLLRIAVGAVVYLAGARLARAWQPRDLQRLRAL